MDVKEVKEVKDVKEVKEVKFRRERNVGGASVREMLYLSVLYGCICVCTRVHVYECGLYRSYCFLLMMLYKSIV